MYLPGHLAAGYLAVGAHALARNHTLDVRRALWPALLGTVTPDIIDKPLDIIGIFAYSRAFGHSLIFLVGLWLWWRWLKRRGSSWAMSVGWWLAGIATHLGVDLLNDMMRGLERRGFFYAGWPYWPVSDYGSHRLLFEIGDHLRIHPTFTSLEIATMAAAVAVGMAMRVQLKRRVG